MIARDMVTIPTSARYFANAEPYLRGNYRIQLRRELVRELIGEPRGKRILDLGCGDGAISLPMAKANDVTLVDNSAAMLEAARANAAALGGGNCTFVHADADELDVGRMDIVLAIGLLAHVDSTEGVIRTISRHLGPGGVAVLQLSDSNRLLCRIGRLLWTLSGRGYSWTSRSDVLKNIERFGLRLSGERNHLVYVPGMQRILGSALIPYDRMVRRYPALARHGTETILLLRKDA